MSRWVNLFVIRSSKTNSVFTFACSEKQGLISIRFHPSTTPHPPKIKWDID